MTDSNKDYDCSFGGCPQCGGTHGYVNIDKQRDGWLEHWFVCDEHKTIRGTG
jgi:hypothetical protein